MIARVTKFQVDTSRRDEATLINDTRIAPGLRQEIGFRDLYAMIDPATGHGLVVTVWDSEENELASRAKAAHYFGMLGSIVTAPPSASDLYDVVGTD